jgi:hypothetical protein
MPQVGFKPTISVFEQAKTFCFLDSAATVMDIYVNGLCKLLNLPQNRFFFFEKIVILFLGYMRKAHIFGATTFIFIRHRAMNGRSELDLSNPSGGREARIHTERRYSRKHSFVFRGVLRHVNPSKWLDSLSHLDSIYSLYTAYRTEQVAVEVIVQKWIREGLGLNSGRDTGYPDWIFRSFLQSLQTTTMILLRLVHHHLLSNTFQFIIHPSSYHPNLHYNMDTEE